MQILMYLTAKLMGFFSPGKRNNIRRRLRGPNCSHQRPCHPQPPSPLPTDYWQRINGFKLMLSMLLCNCNKHGSRPGLRSWSLGLVGRYRQRITSTSSFNITNVAFGLNNIALKTSRICHDHRCHRCDGRLL